MEFVKGVEELFLGIFLSGDELDIVDNQQVAASVFFPESVHGLVSQVVGEVVEKLFDGGINDDFVLIGEAVADGLEQVGFPQTDTTVDKKRVVELSGLLADTLGDGVGELVGVADDEAAEGIGRVENGAFGHFIVDGQGLLFPGLGTFFGFDADFHFGAYAALQFEQIGDFF